MKLELVSYINELTDLKRLCATIEIINQSGADIILFSGHTIGFVNDIQALRENITNTKTIAFLELKDINSAKLVIAYIAFQKVVYNKCTLTSYLRHQVKLKIMKNLLGYF